VSDATQFSGGRHGTLSRFHALSEAVRRHEQARADGAAPHRERDNDLYERLRELERSLPPRDDHAPPFAKLTARREQRWGPSRGH